MLTVYKLAAEMLRSAGPRRLRTLREFSESDVVCPDGQFRGRPFRIARQPVAGILFDAMDAGIWSRYAITAPSQCGKTLCGWVIPALWLLAEWRETIVIAAPTVTMALDKWRVDLEPALRMSRHRDLLPKSGAGARGGETQLIQLTNGANVRLMGGTGDDKSRSGFTARGALLTEIDGMDEIKSNSRESDPVTQIEQRTKSWGSRALIVMECTPSLPTGRIWREYEMGTASRIASPCVHCGEYVTPEREQLIGWRDASNEREAADLASWSCPACRERICDGDRAVMLGRSKLVHRGQEVDRETGKVRGDDPGSMTLGFRWGAFANLLTTPGEIGAAEWRALRLAESEHEGEELRLRQFVYALPAQPKKSERRESEISILDRIDRAHPRATIPPWAKHVTLGVDVGHRMIHWTLAGWTADATGHICDYGIVDTADGLTTERAIVVALRQIRDMALRGWNVVDGGKTRAADLVVIDAGDGTVEAAITGFCAEPDSVGLCWPSKGEAGKLSGMTGTRTTGNIARVAGDHWRVVEMRNGSRFVAFDANRWKSWLSERCSTALGSTGAMTLCAGAPRDHHAFAAHLRAERMVTDYDNRKGMVTKWQSTRSANHWLDSTVLACLGAALRGVSPSVESIPSSPRPAARPAPTQKPRRQLREQVSSWRLRPGESLL